MMITYLVRYWRGRAVVDSEECSMFFKGDEERMLNLYKQKHELENDSELRIEVIPVMSLKPYNYMEEMISDLLDKIENADENGSITKSLKEDEAGTIQWLIDDSMEDDDITGGASLYYFGSQSEAKAAVIQNMELLEKSWFSGSVFDADADSKEEFAERLFLDEYEYFDVLIRQYLLPEAVKAAVEKYKKTQFGKWLDTPEPIIKKYPFE